MSKSEFDFFLRRIASGEVDLEEFNKQIGRIHSTNLNQLQEVFLELVKKNKNYKIK